MKTLEVPFFRSVNKDSPLREASPILDKLEKNPIENTPWPAYPYKPEVYFTIAHHNDCIFIKFFVSENATRALYKKPNDPVYKDSCVEFFIALNDEKEYYNFEFNSIGTCLLGFGSEKTNRRLLPEEIIAKIRHYETMTNGDTEKNWVNWELTLMIPTEVFIYHENVFLRGMTCRANFFKCGDELPEPHFLTWSNIKAETPDFHLPEFLGTMYFA